MTKYTLMTFSKRTILQWFLLLWLIDVTISQTFFTSGTWTCISEGPLQSLSTDYRNETFTIAFQQTLPDIPTFFIPTIMGFQFNTHLVKFGLAVMSISHENATVRIIVPGNVSLQYMEIGYISTNHRITVLEL